METGRRVLRRDIGSDETGKGHFVLCEARLILRIGRRVEGRLPRPAGLSKRGASSSVKQRHGYRNAAWKRSNRVPTLAKDRSRAESALVRICAFRENERSVLLKKADTN